MELENIKQIVDKELKDIKKQRCISYLFVTMLTIIEFAICGIMVYAMLTQLAPCKNVESTNEFMVKYLVGVVFFSIFSTGSIMFLLANISSAYDKRSRYLLEIYKQKEYYENEEIKSLQGKLEKLQKESVRKHNEIAELKKELENQRISAEDKIICCEEIQDIITHLLKEKITSFNFDKLLNKEYLLTIAKIFAHHQKHEEN